MKKFKITDLIISTCLLTGFIVYWVIKLDDSFFTAYLVVGAWQLVSMVIHAYNKWFTNRWSTRYGYHWITFISLITVPASCWILLLAAPVMALYYTYLCYKEVYFKMRRPMYLLK